MTNLAFDVFWRDHGASKGMSKLGDDTKKAHGEVTHLSSLAPKLGAAFGAFIGIDVFGGFIRDARESQAISRITEARIRSTGGAAHLTAAQVGDLATAISNKTGADDEAIQSGENILLTFTKVRNEVGRGNDIFNQTAMAATDMAAALNHGTVTAEGQQQAAMLLGKALNDPVKGMTALRRAGVSFTQQQQDQVKAMVKAGDVLGAQKVILKEVGVEFGGSAAAAADPLQRLSVITGNLGEQIGGALLPAVDDFANFMADTGAPAISSMVTALTNIPGPAYAAAAGLAGIVVVAKAATKVHEAYRDVLLTGGKVLDFFAARAAAAAAAEAAQATAAEGAAVAETAHAKASGTAAVATGEVAVASEGAAAAETSQAVAADAAAVSTGRLGLAAQGAGAMLGGLAAKAMLAGGIGGLAYLSAQVTSWQGTAEVTGVKTDELADALLHMSADARAPKAALDAVTTSGERYWSAVETGTDVMTKFGSLAKGAFGDGLSDIAGRALTGSERMDRFAATASQFDGALTAMVQSGHAKDAVAFLAQVKTQSGLSDAEFVHVTNHLPGYTAAIGSAGAATSTTAGAAKDLATSTAAAKAAADAHAKSLQDEIDRLTGATDAFLGARSAARGVKDAQDALTKALHDNGRGLNENTVKGRANEAALDAVAQATRSDLKAKLDAGMPMARFAAAVANSRTKLIAEAAAAGMTRAAARRYADQILRVPTKQVTNFLQPGLAGARRAVDAVNSAIRHLGGKNVVISMNAAGNLVERIGSGPMKNKPLFSAAGGPVRGPGGPTQDAVPAMLSNGEHVMTASEVKAAGGHGAVAAWRRSLIGYAGGGPVVNVQARGRLGQQRGGLNAWENAMLLATGRAAGEFGGGPIPGGAGVARWAPMMRRALAAVGLSQSLLPNELRQIATESGGNPNAVQGNIGDVNNRSGDLAKGLLQIIGATYRAFHWPGTAWNVFDPWSNMTTSLNYQRHRYPGRIAQVIGHGHGYDGGGLARGAGLLAKGPRPERMLSPRQTDVFERAMNRVAPGGGAAGGVQIDVHLHGSAQLVQDQIVTAFDSFTRNGRLDRPLRRIVGA